MQELVIFSMVAILFGVLTGVFFWLKKKSSDRISNKKPESESKLSEKQPVPVAISTVELSLSQKLTKTRKALWGELEQVFGRGVSFTEQEWVKLEETLLMADVGIRTTTKLIAGAKLRLKNAPSPEFSVKSALYEELVALFESNVELQKKPIAGDPLVVMIVGVNGVGKTTTVGKLISQWKKQGHEVLVGAADTFRAAAMEQLKIWADRCGAQFVGGREGGDPGAVSYDAVAAGKARGVGVVLIDTAGRLHTKAPLMDELKKIQRVMKKVIPDAPHETWLVVDATLGQNSFIQAKQFAVDLAVSGIIMTKLDGTARGGVLLSIVDELKLPVRYIGVGESENDLLSFNKEAFVGALIGE